MSQKKIQSVRGMNDISPDVSNHWQFLEKTFADLVHSYGYNEIRTPIVESTNLFKRSIGEATDIVEKEMYTFEDRNGDSLTLRPEGTAGVVRSIIQNGLLQTRLKLWYNGQMFRHERPQKGRYRQFYQLGCEVFGLSGAEIDAEIIAMTARLWRILGLKDVVLHINTLGSSESRAIYGKKLHEYFSNHYDELDDDSKRRLEKNPLRILDSKNPNLQTIIDQAPKLADYLDEDSSKHFALLCELLNNMNIEYIINPLLVRGPDYYNKSVFEWITNKLGAQGTICAGGRYDSLVEKIGGKTTPAVGFAIGSERLLSLIKDTTDINTKYELDLYIILRGDNSQKQGLMLAEEIHQKTPHIKVIVNLDGGSFKTQFKRADKSGAKYAIIINSDDDTSDSLDVKSLQDKTEQLTIDRTQFHNWLAEHLPQ